MRVQSYESAMCRVMSAELRKIFEATPQKST